MNITRKKVIAAAGIVLLAVLLVLLLTGRERSSGVDKLCRYSVTYAEGSKNVTVTISGPEHEGYVWTAENQNDAAVEVKEQRQSGKKAVFKVTALESGSARVVFRLCRNGSAADCVYEIQTDFLVMSGREITVAGDAYSERTSLADTEVVSGSDAAYSVTYDQELRLHILVAADEDDDWCVASSSDVGAFVYVGEKFDGAAEFIVYGTEPGTYNVTLTDTTDGRNVNLLIYINSSAVAMAVTPEELEALRAAEQQSTAEIPADGGRETTETFSDAAPQEDTTSAQTTTTTTTSAPAGDTGKDGRRG